jgi:hypothetical protein
MSLVSGERTNLLYRPGHRLTDIRQYVDAVLGEQLFIAKVKAGSASSGLSIVWANPRVSPRPGELPVPVTTRA